MIKLNAPQELIEEARAKADAENVCEVWEENWPTVEMFLRVSTQWIFTGMGARVGLNYQSIELLFKIYKTKNRRETLEGLQVMEAAVIRFEAQEAKRNGS